MFFGTSWPEVEFAAATSDDIFCVFSSLGLHTSAAKSYSEALAAKECAQKAHALFLANFFIFLSTGRGEAMQGVYGP